jgi:hypothetical protein
MSTLTLSKWQNHPHPIVLNGKPVYTYFLQMAKLSKHIIFKWYNRRLLLSSNGRTGENYFFQTTKLLAPMAKPSTPIVFKQQNCHIYSFQVTKFSTPTVFKWQTFGNSFLQNAIPWTHTLRTAMLSTSTVFK